MVQFIVAGLVFGGIYALSASGIVMTYVSTGVLNLAYASIAFFVARFYYFLLVQHHWPLLLAALVAIVLFAPVMGVLLYVLLFRFLRQANILVKLAATIGLSVALPPIATTLFKNITILSAPGLAPLPVHIFRVDGLAISADQGIAYVAVVVVLLLGVGILRFTEAGLKVRAVVDSEAMTTLSGTNPSAVGLAVWAVSIFLAGLIGVLASPIIDLDPLAFQLLVAAAFAAVVAARFRNLGVAVAVGFAMGIVGSVAQWALPASSTLIQVVVPSIPFAFVVLFLAYNAIRHGSVTESRITGGALDRAIRVDGGAAPALAGVTSRVGFQWKSLRTTGSLATVVAVALLPFILPVFWGGMVGQMMAIAVVFLSLVLVTGEGGMIWLCQVTLAGVGALTTGQLATQHGWPVLAAVIAGGLVAGVMGTVIGLLTIRLGDLYVALVTFTFALLMSTLVFTRPIFYQNGIGVAVSAPAFASTPRGFGELGVGIFCILGLIVFMVRRSTAGLALSAIRVSPTGAQSIGLSVVRMKVAIGALASVVAGIGGGMLAIYSNAALPDSYDVFTGLVWLAVLVTVGVRSNIAALVAAAFYTYVPALFLQYLPASWGEIPTALFGLGAVMVVRHPEGMLQMQAQQIGALTARFRPGPKPEGGLAPAVADAAGGVGAVGGVPAVSRSGSGAERP